MESEDTRCPKCSGTSWITEPAPAVPVIHDKGVVYEERTASRRCECYIEKCRLNAEAAAKIKKIKVFGCDYDREAVVTLLPDALSLAAWTFIDTWDLGYGMLISGNVGVGKTYMASAVCNEVLKLNCRSMTFATVTMMLREFRAFEQSDGSGSLLNDLQDPDLLVLDDIGAEKRTEWTECALYETVAYRVAKKKPIIVTTNCSLPDLEKKIGQRTLDRFVGSLPRGGITIAGKSRRTGVDWSNPDGRDAKK